MRNRKTHQEYFTPQDIVIDLYNRAQPKLTDTVLDTSCGTGNILVYVLDKKLQQTSSDEEGIKALSTLYGVELMTENVATCKQRLLDTYASYYGNTNEAITIINNNIVNGNTLNEI